MQSSSNASPQAEAILEWLKLEMGYRPHSPFPNTDKLLPSVESLRKICRGNMVPVWKFLLERVKSEKTVEMVKRNILIHRSSLPVESSSNEELSGPKGKSISISKEKERERDKEKEKDREATRSSRKRGDLKGRVGSRPASASASASASSSSSDPSKVREGTENEKEKDKISDESSESKERALRERDAAEVEVERLRLVMSKLRKELRGRMLELSREEGERQRVLDEKSDSRHKQLLLDAYDGRFEQAARIFAEYQRRLHRYVEHAVDVQRGKLGGLEAAPDPLAHTDLDAVYPMPLKGVKAADKGTIRIETVAERSVRKSCKALAAQLIERIRIIFPAYDGVGSQRDGSADERKIGMDIDWETIPDNIKETAVNLLKNPPQLLRAMAGYTAQVLAAVVREIEKFDVKADAEKLRYKYENNRIIEDVSVDSDESLTSQSRGSKLGVKGTFRQLRERQRAHLQQFIATEEALNAAAEAKKESQDLVRRIHGTSNTGDATNNREYVQNSASSRQFELDVWAKERELSGLKASVSTLTNEVQRLQKMCEERRAAEDALRKKWKRIEEFDARRTELESIYTELIHLNLAAATAWEQHTKRSREHSATTVIPLCNRVQQKAAEAHDLIEREVSIFLRVPDNRLYVLPSTSQALHEAFGVSGVAGPESLAAVERTADLLTAKAGARDPSAIPSICRINAVTQNISGYDGQDVGLASVVESLRFIFSPYMSPICMLEELARAMRRTQTWRNLVGNGHLLLGSANSSRPEHEKTATSCSAIAAEQETMALEQWLPELKVAVQDAQKCLDDCKTVRGMVDEWWEQPAATAVDWITIDGQNVAAWLAHVKQLQTAFYDKQLL